MMIEHDDVELLCLLGRPTSLHAMKEQLTLVKGWTQLVARNSVEEWPWHEEDIRKGLSRIDTATTRLAELLIEVLPPRAEGRRRKQGAIPQMGNSLLPSLPSVRATRRSLSCGTVFQERKGHRNRSETMKRCNHRRSSLIDDAARVAVLALDWPAGPINVVDDEPAAGMEWLPDYASMLGAPPPPVRHTRERWERGVSNAKARHQLGWQPLYPSWRTGFRDILQTADRSGSVPDSQDTSNGALAPQSTGR